MNNSSSGAGATVMKTNSSGAGIGATFMNRRAPAELCHFYDDSAALVAMRSLTGIKSFALTSDALRIYKQSI